VNPELDRLIDVLLAEELGGRRPADLTGRVLARAFPPRRRLLVRCVCAAAAAAALLAIFFWRASGGPGGPLETTTECGTVFAYPIDAKVEFLGPRDDAEAAVRLTQGEISVRAAKAAAGRRSVLVETPLGEVVTLGTVFSVRYSGKRVWGNTAEGEAEMSLREMGAITLAVLFVSVSEGAVQVSGPFGTREVCAGEEVGVTEQGITGTVTEVNVHSRTSCEVTVVFSPAAVPPGREYGYQFTSSDGKWTGVVTRPPEGNRAFLHVGLPPDAVVPKVGDVVKTVVHTVVMHAPAADRPGQKLERMFMATDLNFPAAGKYALWCELKLPERPEVLPGHKPWSGTVRSGRVEHEIFSIEEKPRPAAAAPGRAAPGEKPETF
jgi:hypothetical protein